MRSVNINIRVTEQEKKEIKKEAQKQNRSVSNFIVWVFKKHISTQKGG